MCECKCEKAETMQEANRRLYNEWEVGKTKGPFRLCTKGNGLWAIGYCPVRWDMSNDGVIRMYCCSYRNGESIGCNKATKFHGSAQEVHDAWLAGEIIDLDDELIEIYRSHDAQNWWTRRKKNKEPEATLQTQESREEKSLVSRLRRFVAKHT